MLITFLYLLYFFYQDESTIPKLHPNMKSGEIKSVIGKDIVVEKISLKEEFKINLTNVKLADGYDPHVGDFILMQADENDEIRYIEPGEKIESKGKITSFDGVKGTIDTKYVFYKECLKDYTPKINDIVEYVAVENFEEKLYCSGYRCQTVTFLEPAASQSEVQMKPASEKRKKKHNKENSKAKPVVLVFPHVNFEFHKINAPEYEKFLLQNISEEACKLTDVQIEHEKFRNSLKVVDVKTSYFEPMVLQPGETKNITIEGSAESNGENKFRVKFIFEKFTVSGTVIATANDISQPIAKTKLYTKDIYMDEKDKIPGQKPISTPHFIGRHVGYYTVPGELKNLGLKSATVTDVRVNILECIPVMGKKLCPENYADKFHKLLFLEEVELFHQFRAYDQSRAQLIQEKDYLALMLPNLAERRPSLCIGDKVIAIGNPENENPYEGYIHHVKENRILLKFDDKLHNTYNGQYLTVQFEFSRSNFRRQHEAIDRVTKDMNTQIFFPMEFKTRQANHSIILNEKEELEIEGFGSIRPWFNPKLNTKQKQSIVNVIRGEARPLPMIIYGPPGTGKTLTLVEAILQIVKLNEDSHVLVGTPSNSAANLITERLLDSNVLKDDDLIRIVSHNYVEKGSVPTHLKSHSGSVLMGRENTQEIKECRRPDGIRKQIPLKDLKKFKIIIGTCASLGTLLPLEFSDKHFTHLFIDEAAQLIEPEAMIPISLLNKVDGQLVLAGDPKQLGPILFSRFSQDFGLNTSFMSRIFESDMYSNIERDYNELLVTRLIDNYRSIPSILELYSDLFYDSTLNPKIEFKDDIPEAQILQKSQSALEDLSTFYNSNEKIERWDGTLLKVSEFGVHFVPVNGINRQNSDSPSWYNKEEANCIISFIGKLFGRGLTCEDIGVISPYQQQVKYIKEWLDKMNLKTVPKVGSVEEFQGQERNVILISTVRSDQNEVERDRRYSLGFVKEAKRANVALSRAKSLLVIFGCPKVLATDSNWLNVLRYTIKRKTYHGDLNEQSLNEQQIIS